MDFLSALDPVLVVTVLEALGKTVDGLQGWHYAALASAVLSGAIYGFRKYADSKKKSADVIQLPPK